MKKRADSAWRFLAEHTWEAAGVSVAVLLVIILTVGLIYDGVPIVDDFYANIFTELLFFGLTVFVIDRLYRRRQDRELLGQLIRDLSATAETRDFRDRAIRELRHRGWLYDGSLQGVNLSFSDLSTSNLYDANLGGANLQGTQLRNVNLFGARLSGANLNNARMRDAMLDNANLSGARLDNANLSDSHLGGANLSGANLSGADLSGVDLSGANLGDADLRGVDLRGAKLRGADLRGADLRGVRLMGDELNDAEYDSRTIWQEGFPIPPEMINWDDESTWPEGFTPPEWYKNEEDGDEDG